MSNQFKHIDVQFSILQYDPLPSTLQYDPQPNAALDLCMSSTSNPFSITKNKLRKAERNNVKSMHLMLEIIQQRRVSNAGWDGKII
jgi:hypothetical protein